MINKLLNTVTTQKHNERKAELLRNLMRHEAKIGGQLFGEVPAGHRREFFCLDEYSWVWHEEWTSGGQVKSKTTRYDIRPNGVIKSQNGHYQPITKQEAQRLYDAIKLYEKRVKRDLYAKIPGVVVA